MNLGMSEFDSLDIIENTPRIWTPQKVWDLVRKKYQHLAIQIARFAKSETEYKEHIDIAQRSLKAVKYWLLDDFGFCIYTDSDNGRRLNPVEREWIKELYQAGGHHRTFLSLVFCVHHKTVTYHVGKRG